VPIKVRLFQPWKGWVMYSAWLFAGGEAMGITTYGWYNSTTSIDGHSKTAFINTTWDLNAVIFAPERIVPMSFIAHAGYQVSLKLTTADMIGWQRHRVFHAACAQEAAGQAVDHSELEHAIAHRGACACCG
jgi:hypothetical protein